MMELNLHGVGRTPVVLYAEKGFPYSALKYTIAKRFRLPAVKIYLLDRKWKRHEIDVEDDVAIAGFLQSGDDLFVERMRQVETDRGSRYHEQFSLATTEPLRQNTRTLLSNLNPFGGHKDRHSGGRNRQGGGRNTRRAINGYMTDEEALSLAMERSHQNNASSNEPTFGRHDSTQYGRSTTVLSAQVGARTTRLE